MKKYFLLCALPLIFCACTNRKKTLKEPPSAYHGIVKKTNESLLKSLLLHKTSNDSIWALHEKNLNAPRGYYDYKYEMFVTPNKKKFVYATSDNAKFKKLLTSLPNISPVDFIVELTTFKGKVIAETDLFFNGSQFEDRLPTFPNNWVNRTNLGTLLELCKVAAPSANFDINSSMSPIDSYINFKEHPRNLEAVVGLIASQVIRLYYLSKLKLKLPYPSNGRDANIMPLVEEWYKSGAPESALQSYIDKYKASN